MSDILNVSEPSVLEAAESLLMEQTSPFALTENHEFPDPSQPKIAVEEKEPETVMEEDVVSALPGTPGSPYRHCPCLGVYPGRVCGFCYGTKWTKICAKCEGEGRIDLSHRRGAVRSMPCGNCGSKGTLPASRAEVEEARRLAESQGKQETSSGLRRAVRLAGIGVTTHKRSETVLSKKRAAKQNEKRKLKYAAQRRIAEQG